MVVRGSLLVTCLWSLWPVSYVHDIKCVGHHLDELDKRTVFVILLHASCVCHRLAENLHKVQIYMHEKVSIHTWFDNSTHNPGGISLKRSGYSIESVQPRPHPSNFTKTFILLDCQFQSSYNLKSWLIIIIKCIKLWVPVVLILLKSCPNLTPEWMWNVIRCRIDLPIYIFSTVLSKSLGTCSYLSSK